jgi:hypothetical protein
MSPRNSKTKAEAQMDVFVVLLMVSTLALILANVFLGLVLAQQYDWKLP